MNDFNSEKDQFWITIETWTAIRSMGMHHILSGRYPDGGCSLRQSKVFPSVGPEESFGILSFSKGVSWDLKGTSKRPGSLPVHLIPVQKCWIPETRIYWIAKVCAPSDSKCVAVQLVINTASRYFGNVTFAIVSKYNHGAQDIPYESAGPGGQRAIETLRLILCSASEKTSFLNPPTESLRWPVGVEFPHRHTR